MGAIDYEKYSNMSQKQLLNALTRAKKRSEKIKATMQEKLNHNSELIKFLKARINLEKQEFIPYEKSGLPELTREIEKQFTPQELEQIRQEVKDLINMDYGDEL